MNKKLKLQITNKLMEWLDDNAWKSKIGKILYTRYDVIKSLCEFEFWDYEQVEKLISENTKLSDELDNWLNNNFWHIAITLKIPRGVELYIETQLKLKYKKQVPNFVNDIPTPKIKVEKFTMNNEIDGVPNFVNENDEIMNLGKPEDFEDLDISFEEEMDPDHD